MTGRFGFRGMTIEVCSYRGELTGEESYWMRRVDSEPEVTVGVRRSGKTSVSNLFSFSAAELDRALTDFLSVSG